MRASLLACALLAGCGPRPVGVEGAPIELATEAEMVEQLARLADSLTREATVDGILATVGASQDPTLPASMEIFPGLPGVARAHLSRYPDSRLPYTLSLDPIDAAQPTLGALAARFGPYVDAQSDRGRPRVVIFERPRSGDGPWSVAVVAELPAHRAIEDTARVISITLRRDPPEDGSVISRLAEELADLLPDSARADARGTFADDVVQWDLRNASEHPYPDRVLQLVREGLLQELGTDEAARPERLADIVCERRFGRLSSRIHGLAVARFIRDRGGAPPPGAYHTDIDTARPYLRLAQRVFDREIARARVDLSAWETSAPPRCSQTQRVYYTHARLALDSAQDGHFYGASGQLYVFLRNAGDNPRRIDAH
jgi:hypothetical protein